MPAPKPCLSPRCPEFAEPGKSHCRAHMPKSRSRGTTASWAQARKVALDRAGHRCERCGRTEQQARADGTWLEAHHADGRGVSADEHDLDQIVVLCRQPCHLDTLRSQRAKRRRYIYPWQAEAEARAQRELLEQAAALGLGLDP
jgi:hypothetical protein